MISASPLPMAILLITMALSGCDGPVTEPGSAPDLSFDGFIRGYTMPSNPQPLPSQSLPPGNHCTPLPDGPPYRETILAARQYIAEHVDAELVEEASAHLTGGISYRQTLQGDAFPYSAYYGRRSIQLYDKLFEFSCLEDIVSTLLHELVHAVQMSRYVAGSNEGGAFDLEAADPPWLVAEMMADSYQIMVSRELGLVSAEHAEKILRLHNRRRAQVK